MFFQWFRVIFQHVYVAPADGPECLLCNHATEVIEVGSYRNKCFCRHCMRHFMPEKP